MALARGPSCLKPCFLGLTLLFLRSISRVAGLHDLPVPPQLSRELPGTQATLSEAGLVYAKDVLVEQVLQELIPLQVPDIHLRKNSPIGHVDVSLTGIILPNLSIGDSKIDLSSTPSPRLTIFASGIEANLTLHWRYRLAGGLVPIPVSDGGTADVLLNGMQSGITFNLTEDGGTVSLLVLESGTYIEGLHISLHGGASWLYNWFVHSFGTTIRAAVENAVSEGVLKAISKLDKLLQALPRRIPIDGTSEIDVTVSCNPLVDPAFLNVAMRGEFLSVNSPEELPYSPPHMPPDALCGANQSHITLSVSDYMLNSAASVYYKAGVLHWTVDSLPDASPVKLNTQSWRYLIPKLYAKYPNAPMLLHVQEAASPVITVTGAGLQVLAVADMIMSVVLADGTSLDVACITMSATLSGAAGLEGNNVTGVVQLNELSLNLKWSDIGNFHMTFIQTTARTVVKYMILPEVNARLAVGFPLPVIPGVAILHGDVRYAEQYFLVCADLNYTGLDLVTVQEAGKNRPERGSGWSSARLL